MRPATIPTVVALLTVVFLAAAPSPAQIINHTNVAGVPSLPQATMNAVGTQKWFFSHASVGSNMIDGMNSLHSSSPTFYKLVSSWVGDNGSQANNPPSPTVAGTIYECPRGNPGWQAKITIFQNSVNNSGWRAPVCPIVMDKFCYIDQGANATQYVNAMSALEAAWPTTIVVYMTMPLMTSSDSDNVLRNQYNTAVRQYCQSHGRLLFDIADMEAWSPGPPAVQSTFTYGGQTYQKMYSPYSSDGGHLNSTGCQRIAQGWYAVAATIATAPDCNGNGVPDNLDIARGTSADANGNGIPDTCEATTGDMNCDSTVNGADISPFVLALINAAAYQAAYPSCDRMRADCNGNGTVDTADISAFVTRLIGS